MKTAKRRGFVLATVMIALTVIVVLTSVLFLYLQTDRFSLSEEEALLNRDQWLAKIEQKLLNDGSITSGEKIGNYYCFSDDVIGSDGCVTYYVSTKESLGSARLNYLVKIELKTNKDESDNAVSYTITRWEINY